MQAQIWLVLDKAGSCLGQRTSTGMGATYPMTFHTPLRIHYATTKFIFPLSVKVAEPSLLTSLLKPILDYYVQPV